MLIVGVGGQGVIMVSKVLAMLCQHQGHEVKQSEVHGMAKRGGTVFSHVRFGARVYSPTIPEGDADILVALEWAEGLRWLPYLRHDGGMFIADTKRIVPPFSCRDRSPNAALAYVSREVRNVLDQVPDSLALDAAGMAAEAGAPKAANTVLLGALSTALDFAPDDWKSMIARVVPAHTVEANLKAFDAGRERALRLDREPQSTGADPAAGTALPRYSPRLEIVRHWCKRCDICVRFCPERCLRLDQEGIVELFAPDRCTGCRVCEWLCPDFAITVHNEPQPCPTS